MRCSNCDYAANVEVGRSAPRAPQFPAAWTAPQEVETPGVTTIEGLAEFLGVDPRGDREGDADRASAARSCSRSSAAITGCTS